MEKQKGMREGGEGFGGKNLVKNFCIYNRWEENNYFCLVHERKKVTLNIN